MPYDSRGGWYRRENSPYHRNEPQFPVAELLILGAVVYLVARFLIWVF